jgi:hypothetical protein
MRSGRFHRIVAAVATAIAIALAGTPAWSEDYELPADDATSPPMFDLFVLRPVGIVSLALGTALFIAPVAPLTLISRPSDIGKPFGKLVTNPVRYVFSDPLGDH